MQACIFLKKFVKDTDVQTDQSRISAQWFGFEHPHLDVNYEVAVGSGGHGSYDVSNGFIDVRNATSYQLDGLDLTPLMVKKISYHLVNFIILVNFECLTNFGTTSGQKKTLSRRHGN